MTLPPDRRRITRAARLGCTLLVIACSADSGSGPGDRRPLAAAIASPDQLCGGPDGACCSAPRAPCSRGLACDELEGVCRRDERRTPDAVELCHADADCAAGRRCCSAGAYGTCEALDAAEPCPLPDLAVLASGEGITISEEAFEGGRPSAGGCVRERGMRRRLHISAAVANLGGADFILGSRDAALLDGQSGEFLRYSLIDASGQTVATSHGPLPCSDGADPARAFTCAFAGLPAGSLMPALGLECEALDVTELPPGTYRARIELGQAWPDQDPSNGRVELTVELPSFEPLEPCPPVANPLQGLGTNRECGWVRAELPGDGTCDPGELVILDCGSCTAPPMLRFCAGDAVCSGRSAAVQVGGYFPTLTGALAEPCSRIQSICPRDGRYSVLIAPEDRAGDAVPCTLSEGSWF